MSRIVAATLALLSRLVVLAADELAAAELEVRLLETDELLLGMLVELRLVEL